jgi:hypothetical protein
MALNPAVTDLLAFRFEDFSLRDYDPTRTSRPRWRCERDRR